MFFVFLTIVSSVAILSSVAYKYLEIKARKPLENEDIMQLQQEIHGLKKRLENVEAILIADSEKTILDESDPETFSSSRSSASRKVKL